MEDIDDLLAKQLAGENSPDEAAAVQAWLTQSPDNQQYFAGLQQLWDDAPSAAAPPPRAVDTEAALLRVKGRLSAKPRARVVSMGGWVRWAAAAAVLLAVVAVWLLKPAAGLEQPDIAALTAPRTDTLADGSVVTLNRRSALVAAQGFGRRERRLRLQGEAFFQVKPDSERPFVVEADAVEITVVGTAFNVDERSRAGQVVVSVTEGKVQVTAADQTLLLLPGDRATYTLATRSLARLSDVPDPNDMAYQTRVFRFVGTPLREVAERLSAVYGVDISLKNKALEECPLRADYENLPLEEVLERLKNAFSLRIEVLNGERIVLDGEGCE